MGSKQNSIVLNGKLYDAVTGTLIHAPATTPQPKPVIHKKTGLVMDGFVSQPGKKHKPSAAKHTAKAPSTVHHKVHAQPHKPQRAATLMRSAVSKPAKVSHKQPEPARHLHDERTAARLARAQAVSKSTHIHKFPTSHAAQRTVTKKHAPVAVATAPVEPPTPSQVHRAAPAPHSASEALFTKSLKHATAHEANQPFAKKPKKRLAHSFGFKRHTANLALGGLAVLILAGFFTYQNIPNLSVRLASTRAGFQARVPGYQPSGFTQNGLVTYGPGKVTISFHSNSDERAFQLTQQVSNWNSQALATNYLTTNKKPYQTYQASGKTIYIYDNTSATWVNGGVWYQIEGKSSLTSDQLLKIANSI